MIAVWNTAIGSRVMADLDKLEQVALAALEEPWWPLTLSQLPLRRF